MAMTLRAISDQCKSIVLEVVLRNGISKNDFSAILVSCDSQGAFLLANLHVL